LISGTATEQGICTITVQAQDIGGRSDTQAMCLNVIDPFDTNVVTAAVDGQALTIADVVASLLGQGVQVSNVRLNGVAPVGPYAGAGLFDGASGILGIERGIVLSSGAVLDAPGPNDADNTSGSLNTGEDLDLTQLARESSSNPTVVTQDRTVIEFDFVPSSNQVKFRYVFGSEEYNEYVASQYNDAFAFYITGPDGIKRNWALVPGIDTAQAVAINTINNGNPSGTLTPSNPHLYRDNDPLGRPATAPPINIEADGLTVVLTLAADVEPGKVHTMKLAIADAGDQSFDSWVFIEAQSFHAVETCNNGKDDDADGLIDSDDPDCAVCPLRIIAVEPIDGDAPANKQVLQAEPSGSFMVSILP
jgi:hypothetical protein